MPLKFRHTNREAIAPEHLPLYTERDGAFVLDVEGAVEKAKLEEFRASNIALTRERDELRQRFDGINPDEVRKLADEKRALEEAAQLKAGEFEKVLEARLKAQKAALDKQVAGIASERDALTSRLSAIQIDQAVVVEATKRGLRPTALADITARARSTFRLVNGAAQAFDADGQTVRTGKDGVAPMTLAEWIDTQVSEAPHLFEPNAGAGGGGATSQYGSGPGGAVSGARPQGDRRNPFRKETWNLTEQMRLQKIDPHLAARLRASA
jgi:hypothetical protein